MGSANSGSQERAWPAAPAVFVFDEPLLSRLRLSAKRLVFIAETVAELAEDRAVRVLLGDPVLDLEGVALASTFAPVPEPTLKACVTSMTAAVLELMGKSPERTSRTR